jgi:RimJ/RimL family protein N-acetyltransferase
MQVLATTRLRLREFTLDDAPYIVAQLTDPMWIQHIGDRKIHGEDDARRYLEAKILGAYAAHGVGLWAMDLASTGETVGMCGLIRRTGLDDVDLGFALLPAYRGAGYASEAAQATLAHGHAVLKLARIVAITAPGNERSALLLRRIGMRYERTIHLADHGGDSLLFSSEA